MNFRVKSILCVLLLGISLSACSQDDNQNTQDKTQDKQIEETTSDVNKEEENTKKNHEKENDAVSKIVVKPLPNTYQELAELPVGEHAGIAVTDETESEVLKIFADLPDIENNPSQTEMDYFYRELLKKVQKKFNGPEETINQLRFQAIGDPEMEDTRYQFKENLNVVIILDASGSMAFQIGNKTRMEAAKDSIRNFVKQLPPEAKVGIRVYGQEGTGSDADKQLSCSSSELVYPISPYDEGAFNGALDKFAPAGWTPIELAIREAQKDLASFEGANNTNIVYLVSDGVSTCDDDPVTAAKDLYNSNISPIVNVIGFGADSKAENQLIEIAKTTEGIYQKVTDESELSNELQKINDLTDTWQEWKENGYQSIEYNKTQNKLKIFDYISVQSYNAGFERLEIENILYTLEENGRLSQDSLQYLIKINNKYHKWINSEIGKFREELNILNEQGYKEAIDMLEQKYQQNSGGQ
ncbi:VWA domain-containing protein [Bacillaceae bacterium Marseille-Q3522]|nr:VWA domain-containing protein [Bacillaceae bacterium Marseille-Q3522]